MRACTAVVLSSFFSVHLGAAYEIDSYIKHPSYVDKIIETHEGGIFAGDDFRLQAKHLRLVQENGQSIVYGDQDVALLYKGTLFTAEQIVFNLTEKKGVAHNVRGLYGIWYLTAEKVDICNEGVVASSKTTLSSENTLTPFFSLTAKQLEISHEGQAEGEGVALRVGSIPVFYLPTYAASLKKNIDSPVTYGLSWIAGQGPELIMRYRLYENDSTAVFLRGDVRPSRGFGGAFETYCKEAHRSFTTKSYVAHDTFYRDNNPNKKRTRYRLQGNISLEAPNKKTYTEIQYDKISDRNMPVDFPSSAFELDAAETTRLSLRRRSDYGLFGIRLRPRINDFQGFTQQLPSSFFRGTPLTLIKDHLFFQTNCALEYLKYTHANDIPSYVEDYNSGRAEVKGTLYGSLSGHGASFFPYVGYNAIGYTNSPSQDAKFAGALLYGGTATYTLTKKYTSFRHNITPFVTFTGITSPTTNPDNHYIFSLYDGVDRLQQFEYGCKTSVLFPKTRWELKGAALSFPGQSALGVAVPKGLLTLNGSMETIHFLEKIIWNFQFHELDFSKTLLQWTFTKDAAFSLEMQHRGQYYYRKDDLENYILDVSRSPGELLNTPISDKRTLILTRAQFKITDLWWLQFQSHHGFGRKTQRGYTEFKLDLFTRLATHWKAKVSIAQTTLGPVFGAEVKIVK